jgi:hypothetical protein
MTSKIKAILALAPNADVTEYNNIITWNDGNPNNITEEQIIAKQAELQADYDAKQYQRNRAKEYPSIQDQLDMQYWDKINSTNTWQDAINAVKTKYPKETE